MDVSCSTQCFSHKPLEQALRQIAELEFSKVDLRIAPDRGHVTPTQLQTEMPAVLHRIRQGPTIGFAALTVEVSGHGEDYLAAMNAVAHFGKQLAAPLLVIEAAQAGSSIVEEVERLKRLQGVISLHGCVLTLLTKTGTLTETPAGAIELCQLVDGLGLTLDPSHYLCGPHQGKGYDEVYPFVRHVHLRDSGRRLDQLQVRIGRGEIEYGRIVTSLQRFKYHGSLTVAMDDTLESDMDVLAEVRKLRLVLESLL